MRSARFLACLPVLALAIACGSSDEHSAFDNATEPANAMGPNGIGSLGGNGEAPATDISGTQPMMGCGKMDILFVVDNSGSMSEEQANLAKNFPGFAKVLNEYKTPSGMLLDYHVGVVTTDVTSHASGDSGQLRQTKTCPAAHEYLSRDDAAVETTLACLAKVGTLGDTTEQPLAAVQLALSSTLKTGVNAGFRRDDAVLAIVILTDEEDQSAGSNFDNVKIADVAAFLEGVAPKRWATHVIAGPAGGCTSPNGEAEEAKRLQDFVSIAGKNGSFSSICEADLASGLSQAFKTFDYACQNAGTSPK